MTKRKRYPRKKIYRIHGEYFERKRGRPKIHGHVFLKDRHGVKSSPIKNHDIEG